MCGEEHDVLSCGGSAVGCRRVSKSSVAAVWDEQSRAAASSCVCRGVALMQTSLPVFSLFELCPRHWLLPAFLKMRVPWGALTHGPCVKTSTAYNSH